MLIRGQCLFFFFFHLCISTYLNVIYRMSSIALKSNFRCILGSLHCLMLLQMMDNRAQMNRRRWSFWMNCISINFYDEIFFQIYRTFISMIEARWSNVTWNNEYMSSELVIMLTRVSFLMREEISYLDESWIFLILPSNEVLQNIFFSGNILPFSINSLLKLASLDSWETEMLSGFYNIYSVFFS